MSVNNSNLNPAALNSTATNGSLSTGKTAQLDPVRINSSASGSPSASSVTDEVQLSSLSSKINELQPGSPAREAYIESLRNEFASGQLQDNPAETARGIVSDALLK
jgi:anti-sigma28 factor (negative regulator of flagellin synthesis)